MKTSLLAVVGVVAITLGLSGCAKTSANTPPPKPAANPSVVAKKTLRAFGSEQELAQFLREMAKKQEMQARRISDAASMGVPVAAPAMTEDKSPAAATRDEESITNVQHAGVDEGGIVKLHGNYLVVLRRGRLFTVAIGDRSLEPVSSVNAYAPDIDPRYTWYDEMLISDDNIAVIGFSYERGGTEVGLFNIDAAGKLSYRSTYHLRSNDYYSSRNYASRLIGTKLIFYSPLYFYPGADDPFQAFPALRKWHKGATSKEFHRIISANRIYRPENQSTGGYWNALHTVTTCDLSQPDFDCQATSVIGPWGRVFYVSPTAVYVWVTDWAYYNPKNSASSMLYRMPLDGTAPSALRVSGSPVDQFSFLESEDGQLNVVVRSDANGDGMWGAEWASGDLALMRIPLASFSDGIQMAPQSSYLKLPRTSGYTFQNRFVGDYLLYGAGSGWGYPNKIGRSTLVTVRWADGDVHKLALTHGTDRIEQMGNDAVVVGTDGKDLHFTAVRLGSAPEVADDYIREAASQSELRSQGFFYKPDGEDSGMIGLPISTPGRAGYEHLFENSAAILFLHNKGLHFEEVGELEARPTKGMDDKCRASCVDWYGNARPLFIHGRVMALLGYELVEGSMEKGRIQELRRISYAPQNLTASYQEAGK